MRMRLLPASVLALTLSVPAAAELVTYELTGTSNGSWNWSGIADPVYDLGVPGSPWAPQTWDFTALITIETTTPLAGYGFDFNAYVNPITAFSLDVGPNGLYGSYEMQESPHDTNSNSSVLTFVNDATIGGPGTLYDQLVVGADLSSSPGDPAGTYRFVSLHASSFSGALYPSMPTLGSSFLDDILALGSSAGFQLSFGIAGYDEAGMWQDVAASANVTGGRRLTSSVPEPGTLGLFGAAFVALWLARRRDPSRASA